MRVEIFGPTLDARVLPFDGGTELNIHDDLLSIQTSKSIGSPTGTFEITLTARRDSYGRTWAKRIRPMDYIEVHMSRSGQRPTPGTGTVVMRCLVDNVRESNAVQGNRVRRVITVSGRDFGKILLKRALVFFTQIDPVYAGAIQQVGIGLKLGPFGMDVMGGFMTPLDFISRVRDFLLTDPTVGATFRNASFPTLHSYTDIPTGHVISFPFMPPTTGSIWTFLEPWQGKPWNEMFIRDDQDAPRLYWRQAPFKGRDGEILAHGDRIPASNALAGVPNYRTHDISLSHVISEDVGTSDNDAYCYYYTQPLYAERFGGEIAFIYPPGGFGSTSGDDIGSDPFGVSGNNQVVRGTVKGGNPILRRDIFERYGFAALKQTYPLIPLTMTQQIARGEVDDTDFATINEVLKLNSWMHNAFSHNPALESGTLVVRGHPEIQIGNYVNISEQNREFYVEGVNHNFSINPPDFVTTLAVTRGLWLKHNPYPELDWL